MTPIVYSTIQNYGFNSCVGKLAFPQPGNGGFPNGDKPYSKATAEAMDDEARTIVTAAYQRTVDLNREKKAEVEQVAQFLFALTVQPI